MSWESQVETPKNVWTGNTCRYATKEEAEAAGDELLSRWYVPLSSRAVETPNDPVNYRFDLATQKNVRLL